MRLWLKTLSQHKKNRKITQYPHISFPYIITQQTYKSFMHMHFLQLLTEYTYNFESSQSAMRRCFTSHTQSYQADVSTHTSPLQRAFVDLWDNCWMRGKCNPFWFIILFQIGHSLIKRWKKCERTLLNWSGTSNGRITAACFSEGFGPTGLLFCMYILYVVPGKDQRIVCWRK